MDRGERRHRTQVAVEKQARIWTGRLKNRSHYRPPDAKRRGQWRKTSAFGCRCVMCRNPRHRWGLLPLPEQRLLQREPDDNPSMAEVEQMEPHGPECCLCHDHGPDCDKCWPNMAEIVTERMLEAGLPPIFVRVAVSKAKDRSVYGLLMSWMLDRDPTERAAIEAHLGLLIGEAA